MKERRNTQPLVVRCKLVLVGDVQCGKTAMLQVLAKDCYPEVCSCGCMHVFMYVRSNVPEQTNTCTQSSSPVCLWVSDFSYNKWAWQGERRVRPLQSQFSCAFSSHFVPSGWFSHIYRNTFKCIRVCIFLCYFMARLMKLCSHVWLVGFYWPQLEYISCSCSDSSDWLIRKIEDLFFYSGLLFVFVWTPSVRVALIKLDKFHYLWLTDWHLPTNGTMLLIAPQTYVPTVFENYTACLELEEQRVELSLWDTSGKWSPLSSVCLSAWPIMACHSACSTRGGWDIIANALWM